MDHNNIDKQIEKLVSKIINETTLEKPSFDFSDKVMSRVKAISKPSIMVYKPLISKKVWAIIFVGFMALVLYAIFEVPSESKGWFDALNFGVISIHKIFNGFPAVTFSKTIFYALIMLSVMIYIQVPILKHYMDRRLKA